jgi:lipoyl(octanoyl) transferase
VTLVSAPLQVRQLGRTCYGDARRLQTELVEARAGGRIPDQLLITEHEEVVTLGRRSAADEPLPEGIAVERVERGGQATWHGPGQIVLYPIRWLPEGRRDLHRYLRDLEQVVIDALTPLGLAAGRREGLTGVWLGEQKLCSLGVAVRRWVAWHGLALNVSNDLAAFRRFRPCGLDSEVMTRVADHAEPPADDPLLAGALERAFRRRFDYAEGGPPDPARSGPGSG